MNLVVVLSLLVSFLFLLLLLLLPLFLAIYMQPRGPEVFLGFHSSAFDDYVPRRDDRSTSARAGVVPFWHLLLRRAYQPRDAAPFALDVAAAIGDRLHHVLDRRAGQYCVLCPRAFRHHRAPPETQPVPRPASRRCSAHRRCPSRGILRCFRFLLRVLAIYFDVQIALTRLQCDVLP